MTEQMVQEAKSRYLKARNQSSYQKKKNGLDWFTLWLDYLQKRNQLSEEKIASYKTFLKR